MAPEHVHQNRSGVQVEIEERPYKQHMARQLIEVRLWESLEDCNTFLFEETDPARHTVEPAGQFLGRVPAEVVTALESLEYEVDV